jgi:hypothetical protein
MGKKVLRVSLVPVHYEPILPFYLLVGIGLKKVYGAINSLSSVQVV